MVAAAEIDHPLKSICVIPSRRGDKDKGMWLLRGMPLVKWLLRTTEPWPCIVTSDSLDVLDLSRAFEATRHVRPEHLRDGTKMVESVLDALGAVPGMTDDTIVHLCQPTSPFLRRCDLLLAENTLEYYPEFRSFQTLIEVPHNFHEVNQREMRDAVVRFVHPASRAAAPTKQQKPGRYAFGNLVSVRAGALRQDESFFAQPSYGHQLSSPFHGLDVDTRADLQIANAYVVSSLVVRSGICAQESRR